MKFAAIQMVAEFAQVSKNLKITKRLASDAFKEGAECVILPEFFTSAMGFHPNMLDVVRHLQGEPMKILQELSKKYNGIIGGSFIARRDAENYNTFVLVFPDGTLYYHDKDQPTMWENCYYLGGNDDGVFNTPIGNIGVALCWEFVRTRTIKRLKNRVDIIVGGSCWWTIPEQANFSADSHNRNLKIMIDTPSKFAKLLGVPIVHSAHAGSFDGLTPGARDFPYKSFYLGETQIVDGSGKILARLTHEDGEGILIEEINLEQKWQSSEQVPDTFWIPDLQKEALDAWSFMNAHGEKYYQKTTKPYQNKHDLVD